MFSRSLHPELYTIHKSRRVERGDYEAQIDITNCGHVITWKAAGMIICEVATSAHQPLPKRRCLLSKPLKGSRSEAKIEKVVDLIWFDAPTGLFEAGKTLTGAEIVATTTIA